MRFTVMSPESHHAERSPASSICSDTPNFTFFPEFWKSACLVGSSSLHTFPNLPGFFHRSSLPTGSLNSLENSAQLRKCMLNVSPSARCQSYHGDLCDTLFCGSEKEQMLGPIGVKNNQKIMAELPRMLFSCLQLDARIIKPTVH